MLMEKNDSIKSKFLIPQLNFICVKILQYTTKESSLPNDNKLEFFIFYSYVYLIRYNMKNAATTNFPLYSRR